MLTFDESFGLSFWLAFLLHAGVAEIWLARRPPDPDLLVPLTYVESLIK